MEQETLVTNRVAKGGQGRIRQKNKRRQVGLLGGVERVMQMYDGAIASVDQEIGKLADAVKQFGIDDNTLFILTADHGESLTEHEIYFDHHGLYNETIHIPLIFKYKELPRGKLVRGFVQHPDIMPTVLDILNIKNELDYDGKSLLPLIYENKQLNPAIFAEETLSETKQMIATHKYKYIRALSKQDAICKYCRTIHGGIEELYDLEKDPGETRNIVNEQPDEVQKMKAELAGWINNMENKRGKIRLKARIKELKQAKRI